MRSTLGDGTPVQARRAWQAPALVELPIGTQTRFAGASSLSPQTGERISPPPPSAPATKLGFAFEMSFPMTVRTE